MTKPIFLLLSSSTYKMQAHRGIEISFFLNKNFVYLPLIS